MTGKRFHICLLFSLFFIPLSFAVATLGNSSNTMAVQNLLKSYMRVQAHEKTMAVATHDKTFLFRQDHRSVVVTCGMANQFKSPIRSVRGNLRFTTYFGAPVVEMPLQESVSLEPGQEAMREWRLQRSDFKDEASFAAFLATPLSRLRQEWTPVELVLADGTVLKP